MYQQIKKLADDAIKLQNKDRMDAALREISALCDAVQVVTIGTAMDAAAPGGAPWSDSVEVRILAPLPTTTMDAEQFVAAETAQHNAGKAKGAKK